MNKIGLIATTTFGLEAVVKRELQNLGYEDIKVENGKVMFEAEIEDIPRVNIWLRSAERVLLKIGEFEATSFDELFEKTKALPWGDWITEDGEFTVTGKSVKSKLFSISDSQAIVKKAVVEKLKMKYDTEWFKEDGPKFTIQVALLNDIATLTINTSGDGLHKRGYRIKQLAAPIKETMAAAMIQLSYWRVDRQLLDPFCGSGTIPIEAAMIGRNIAPGLQRSFASEKWPKIGKEAWKKARVDALKAIKQDVSLNIIASDIDKVAVEIAKENAFEAGVDDCIEFTVKDVKDVRLKEEYGVMITNPPYGERISEKEEIEEMYKVLGRKFRTHKTWSTYIITSYDRFEVLYERKANKKRKLYSGNIKVNYYQFYGERPPKKN